jgi:hypothetical protein
MQKKDYGTSLAARRTGKGENNNLRGYPLYSAGEDFYSKYQEDKDVDTEDISLIEVSAEDDEVTTICVLDSEHQTVGNLDVPGSELDDEQEEIGSEDEENNYYSLGGDDHLDLEEDNGE